MSATRFDWINDLSTLSPAVSSLNLTAELPDELYWDAANKRALNMDAFNLSSCAVHTQAIAGWLQGLANLGIGADLLKKFVTDLTSRNTYGTFSELAAYGMLLRYELPFSIQIPASARDILNPNGSDLDGRINLPDAILFDVKAFGLQTHRIELLTERLQKDFPKQFVAVEGTHSVPMTTLQDLLGRGYKSLTAELMQKGHVAHDGLTFTLRSIKQVQTTVWSLDPYEFAEKNADYAFNYAKQFAKREPFILVFVLHPWLGASTLTTNFSGYLDVFTRSFARRSFFEFRRDRANHHYGKTRAAASRYLSGIMFVNAWAGPSEDQDDTVRLFLNPFARRPISPLNVSALDASITRLAVDDFAHDAY